MKETTRKRKERQFLGLLKKAADQSSYAILLTTAKLEYPHPKILYVNKTFSQMSGYNTQELMGKSPRILQGPKTDMKVLKDIRQSLSEGRVFSGSAINYRKDGSEYSVEWDIAPVRDEQGKVTHYISFQKDITRKIETEVEKEEFFGIISHELKNPISTIKGFIQLMQKNLKSSRGKKLLDYLQTMETETDRITGLLNDLLDFAKVRNKKMISNYQLVDFDDLLSQAVKKFRRTLPSHKIYRRGKVKEKLNIDPTRINQVLVNLLNNAVKYSPNSNTIIVKLERKDRRAIISVQDFGIGIPEDKQREIFERYYRVNKKDSKSIESSGLGLYIASEIVKDHKGEIGVSSKQGLGSTFYFTLPLAK